MVWVVNEVGSGATEHGPGPANGRRAVGNGQERASAREGAQEQHVREGTQSTQTERDRDIYRHRGPLISL
jgi:hypothetical protein